MKKVLAIILSAMMILCLVPFSAFAEEAAYDRALIASEDKSYISSLKEEQIASVILDWVDRQIAAAAENFESFEIEVMGTAVAVDIPEIKGVDDIVAYADHLAELGGDFANLDVSGLKTLTRADGDFNFIYGVIEFMALNSDVFGKVFHWEEGKVFDYGKVGEYILSLDTTVEENKKIVDFYNDYLIGNDIQEKFIAEIAKEMGYTIPTDENGERAETFDETISNGIINWFSGLCENAGILSADGLTELAAYDLRTTDIYTLVENFVGLVQSDNQVKIDTYYNYLLDTVVRTLLKSALGQKAVVGETAALPESFNDTYTDLALLEEISGGQVYYQDADKNYYQVTVADGAVSANAVTWESVVDFEFPTVTIYTGENFDKEVQVYYPTSADAVQVLTYATDKNQALIGDAFTFTGNAVPAEFAELMTDANARALENGFGVAVKQGEEIISELKLTFKEIEEYAEAEALPIAQKALDDAVAGMQGSVPITIDVKLDAIDVVLSYNGWSTEDEFICQVKVDSVKATLSGAMASMVQSVVDSAATSAIGTTIDNPVATVVVDGISGGKGIDASGAKDLLEFLDTDFAIDADLLDFVKYYDDYNGVVGQANRVLYELVDMLVSDAGMEKLALEEGNNDKFTANLEKICATANDMMASAEAIMTDPEVEALLGQAGIDMSALLGSFDLDLLYALNFETVEDLWVSVITLGLDLIDNGENETVAELHTALEGLTNLDAMAVAMTDYLLGECIPALNTAFADAEIDFALTVPSVSVSSSVADGEGKNVIMAKLVDVLYEAATKGVAVVNAIANEAIGHVEGEANIELPTVKFELGVDKADDWTVTLAALVNRVYELADGIIIACDNEYTDTFDKIAAVANAMLPLGSLASNCKSENFAFDVNKVMGFIFDDGLEGDLDGFLRLFETAEKTDDVAAGVPVTKALINASEHIVDSIFPDTVNAEDYEATLTAKEDFTSGDNDVVIASNNMKSINNRKEELVPAALRLVVEAGILPFFAKCENDHTSADLETVLVPGTAATCTKAGVEDAYACADCGYVVSGGGEIGALGHDEKVNTVEATCTKEGTVTTTCTRCDYTVVENLPVKAHSYGEWQTVTAASCEGEGLQKRSCSCGAYEEKIIAATGHADADANYVCDTCGAELPQPEKSFFQKIIDFFNRIIEWFKNLFS